MPQTDSWRPHAAPGERSSNAIAEHRVEVTSYERPDEAARERWSARLGDQPFADVVFDWCEAARAVETPGFELRYFEAWHEGRPQALAVHHTLRKFRLTKFMGGNVGHFFDKLSRRGFNPFSLDLAYLEMPLCYRPGILFSLEAIERGLTQMLAKSIVESIRANCRCDLFFVRTVSGVPGVDAFDGLGLLKAPFYWDTRLDLETGGMDAYERRLSPNGRSAMRRNRKKFAAAGAQVTMLDVSGLNGGPEQCFLEREEGGAPGQREFAVSAIGAVGLARLLEETECRHRERGESVQPIQLGERYFRALAAMPPQAVRIHVACVKNKPVGFALTLMTGNELFFTHCGLDYEAAEESRAYFNLYYSMVQDAVDQGVTAITFGPEAYEAKRRAGAKTVDTWFFISMERWWMRPLMRLLVWIQKRSQAKEQRDEKTVPADGTGGAVPFEQSVRRDENDTIYAEKETHHNEKTDRNIDNRLAHFHLCGLYQHEAGTLGVCKQYGSGT